MVESFSDASDKRIKRVRLTRAGDQCCQDAKGRMAAFEDDLLSGFTPAERAALQSFLQRANKNLI